MKNSTLITLFIIAILIGAGVYFFSQAPFPKEKQAGPKTGPQQENKTPAPPKSVTEKNMKITSPSFSQGESIPQKYSCDGEDINPTLTFEDIPKEAESFALIVDDPDAPGQTFVHWTVWNIDPATEKIKEDSVPAGVVQGKTGFGKNSYGGPCPPSGEHRYFFKLYALDKELALDSEAGKQDLLKAMEEHKVAEAELMGMYEKE